VTDTTGSLRAVGRLEAVMMQGIVRQAMDRVVVRGLLTPDVDKLAEVELFTIVNHSDHLISGTVRFSISAEHEVKVANAIINPGAEAAVDGNSVEYEDHLAFIAKSIGSWRERSKIFDCTRPVKFGMKNGSQIQVVASFSGPCRTSLQLIHDKLVELRIGANSSEDAQLFYDTLLRRVSGLLAELEKLNCEFRDDSLPIE
jgi:hypothetical protein